MSVICIIKTETPVTNSNHSTDAATVTVANYRHCSISLISFMISSVTLGTEASNHGAYIGYYR